VASEADDDSPSPYEAPAAEADAPVAVDEPAAADADLTSDRDRLRDRMRRAGQRRRSRTDIDGEIDPVLPDWYSPDHEQERETPHVAALSRGRDARITRRT
jgi:hypothetical protein